MVRYKLMGSNIKTVLFIESDSIEYVEFSDYYNVEIGLKSGKNQNIQLSAEDYIKFMTEVQSTDVK